MRIKKGNQNFEDFLELEIIKKLKRTEEKRPKELWIRRIKGRKVI